MKPKKRISKHIIILTAAVCLIFAVSVTAYATNLFRLRDLVLKDNSGVQLENPYHAVPSAETAEVSNSGATETNEPGKAETDSEPGTSETPKPTDMISLQGYSNSNEYKAVAEWISFCGGYDRDGALLAKVGNGPTGLEERYSLYLVYTREMADKLDEIVGKYGLSLHTSIEVFDAENFSNMTGTGNILSPSNISYGGYVYEDGTFHTEGVVKSKSGLEMNYQLMNYKKGSFTDTILNIGNADDYDEWSYKTSSGVTVSLSIGPDKCLVFSDRDSSFVTINVLTGTDEGITKSDLEAFADSFDFSLLN